MEPCDMGVVEASLAIRRGELSPAELLASCLATIERTEPAVHAFVRLTPVDAPPPDGVLHGIPFAVKDLLDTANVATEYGSPVFAGRVPSTDAVTVARIRAAGGVLVGKTTAHEIAYGVSTPQSRNPWNPAKMTSGSSGGSAAALAARQVPMALGTDTGGSLRLPSAFCATTAIRPTFGLVPRDGAMLLASSFDTVGPMARSARDCLLLLQVLADMAPAEDVDQRKVRVGVADVCTPEQAAVADTLRELGAELVEVTLPSLETTQQTGAVLAFAEAADQFRAHLADGVRFAEDIQALLEEGLAMPAVDYLRAGRARAAIRGEYETLFGDVDLILLPTSPVTDLPHGTSEVDGTPLLPFLTLFCFPASLTGLPAIAFPCGFTDAGMPMGAQLLGPANAEPLLAAVTDAYQQVTDWHTRKPNLP